MKSALLIIDLQNDCFTGDSIELVGIEQAVAQALWASLARENLLK
jgi:nicotinamidase-related amidase